MKILIAPLNWGLGHATRCVPLIRQYLKEGHEVVLGGDGDSLVWLYRYFPTLRFIELAPLHLTYNQGSNQITAMMRAIPKLIRFTIADHRQLLQLTRAEHWDLIISDNRFGLFSRKVRSVYITHQLSIRLPRRLCWFEGVARAIHRIIYRKYDEVWVPDYLDSEQSLSGVLSHPAPRGPIRYIGLQSRFTPLNGATLQRGNLAAQQPCSPEVYPTVCLLSGLEPQRTILEEELMSRVEGEVLIIRGLIGRPSTYSTLHPRKGTTITLVPYLDDESLRRVLLGAKRIICRSGYSTIMDLAALGVLDKAELIPTPGQTEQEYLAEHIKNYGNYKENNR